MYQGDWPRNATRVRKQTQALAEAGHTVQLLAGNPGGKPRREANDWMEIARVPMLGSPRINRYLGFPIFANPFWLWQVWRAAGRFRADCMIVRDLPLAPGVLAIGSMLGIPVHYEMADVYPIALRANRAEHPGLASRIARNAALAEWLDRFVIRRAASVFAVSEESRQRCLALGAAPDAAVVVGNTPAELPDPGATYPFPADLAGWEDRSIVLFLGNLLGDRGLLEAVEAVARAHHDVPRIALGIIGDGPEIPRLAAKIAELNAGDYVRLLGWKGYRDHPPYYHHAAIGILPFLATEHIEITLANKLFDYMGAALPIVASDVRPMRRVISETGAGILVPPADVPALAAALVALVRDPAQGDALGAKGRTAVERQYSWSEDRRRLLAAVTRTGRSR